MRESSLQNANFVWISSALRVSQRTNDALRHDDEGNEDDHGDVTRHPKELAAGRCLVGYLVGRYVRWRAGDWTATGGAPGGARGGAHRS